MGCPGQEDRSFEQLWGCWVEWSVDFGVYHRDSPGHLRRSPLAPTQSYPVVFGLSAKTPGAVKELQSCYLTYLRSISELTTPSFRDLAYTSTPRRQLYPHRVSITADRLDFFTSSFESAVPNQVVSIKVAVRLLRPRRPESQDGRIAVLDERGVSVSRSRMSEDLGGVRLWSHD